MKKIAMIASVLATAILLFACQLLPEEEPKPNPTKPTEPKKPSEELDWESHNTDYSILIRNNTNERLVGFQGDLTAAKLIGGIPAHASNHGLPNDPKLFDVTKEFPLILLTEKQYNENNNNLLSLKNTPFTRVYVFFNKQGDNSVVYEIAAGLGGENSLRILNPSSTLNVEIRLGGVAGETVGYAPGGMQETILKLNDGNFAFFPVFKRYNRQRDVVETVYPKFEDGNPWFTTTSFGDYGGQGGIGNYREFTFNVRDLLKGLTMTSGTAWVIIDNQTNQGIRFLEGGSVRKTLSGLENVPSGFSLQWQVDMNRVSNNNYADSRVVSNWKFGPLSYETELQEDQDDSTKLNTVTIERDKMYTITVTGQPGSSSNPIKAWISDTRSIDVSDFNVN